MDNFLEFQNIVTESVPENNELYKKLETIFEKSHGKKQTSEIKEKEKTNIFYKLRRAYCLIGGSAKEHEFDLRLLAGKVYRAAFSFNESERQENSERYIREIREKCKKITRRNYSNYEYYQDIFGFTSDFEMVVVFSERSKFSRQKGIPVKKFVKEYMPEYIFSNYPREDLYFTGNTYKPKKGSGLARHENLYRITCFGIDVDYKKNSKYKNISPEDFYEIIMSELDGQLPEPTWIECGHQLRLIYVLSETVNRKFGRDLERGLRAIKKRFCDLINEALDAHAEMQRAYFRVPGSINSKDGSVIHVEKTSNEKYTVQELLTEYMPELPYTKEEWNERKKKKKTRKKVNGKSCVYGIESLQRLRLSDYERLAETETDIPRELLLHFVATAWKQLPENEDKDLMEMLLGFNKKFINPLPEKEIQSKFRTEGKRFYKYRNSTILRELGISEEQAKEKGLYLYKSVTERKKEERIMAGRTWAQKRERKFRIIGELYDQGYSFTQMAKRSGYSRSTVARTIREIKAQRKAEQEALEARKAELFRQQMLEQKVKTTVNTNGTVNTENTIEDTENKIINTYNTDTGQAA